MLIDDNSPENGQRGHGNRRPEEVIADLKDRLKAVSSALRDQQEEHK